MRYSKEHKEETRSNILGAALSSFRAAGYNGIGVDGIAKAAKVTSGAFYKHFSSKSEAFRTVVSEGLGILRKGIADSQAQHGPRWLAPFSRWYFSAPEAAARCENGPLPMQGGCALPTLTPEIARTDGQTQQLFEVELQKLVETFSAGLPDAVEDKRGLSWTVLALMVGGVALARSAQSEETSAEIASAILASIETLSS